MAHMLSTRIFSAPMSQLLLLCLCWLCTVQLSLCAPQRAPADSGYVTVPQDCHVTLMTHIKACLHGFTAQYQQFAHLTDDEITEAVLDNICQSYAEGLQCLHYTLEACPPGEEHFNYMETNLPDPHVMLPLCFPAPVNAESTTISQARDHDESLHHATTLSDLQHADKHNDEVVNHQTTLSPPHPKEGGNRGATSYPHKSSENTVQHERSQTDYNITSNSIGKDTQLEKSHSKLNLSSERATYKTAEAELQSNAAQLQPKKSPHLHVKLVSPVSDHSIAASQYAYSKDCTTGSRCDDTQISTPSSAPAFVLPWIPLLLTSLLLVTF